MGTFKTERLALLTRSDRCTLRITKNFSVNVSMEEKRAMTDFNLAFSDSSLLLVAFKKLPVLYFIPIVHCL